MIFPQCPRCQNEWRKVTVDAYQCYQCGMRYLPINFGKSHRYDYLTLTPNNIAINWWVNIGDCEVRYKGKSIDIPFLLPYDISPEQLQLYLTFS